jgi:hypothetical protein
MAIVAGTAIAVAEMARRTLRMTLASVAKNAVTHERRPRAGGCINIKQQWAQAGERLDATDRPE